MSDVGLILQELSGSMHLWRNGAICGLAFLVIGCLQLYVSLMGAD